MAQYPVRNEYLWKDSSFSKEEKQPAILGIQIEGPQGRIFSTFFQAGGDGDHATILLCHGFPGNDRMLDAAQAFQRAGFHVMTFHYSGSWGSDGSYRMVNCIAVTNRVLDYLLQHAEELGIDTDRLYLYGHSLGGFVALHVFSQRKELKKGVVVSPANPAALLQEGRKDRQAAKEILEEMEDGCRWLSGVQAKDLVDEIKRNYDKLEFTHLAEDLADRPLFLAGALEDVVTPPAQHIQPVLSALDRMPHPQFRYETFQTDHHYLTSRISIISKAAEFYEK